MLKADTPSGWTSVPTARVVLSEHLGIDRSTLPKETHCCHACNNELCENPLHLYFGSAFDNQQDVPAEVRSDAAASWDRGKRFIAIDPQGIRFVADTFNRLREMVPISVATFYKYVNTQRAVRQVLGQKPNPWTGWRFERVAVAA